MTQGINIPRERVSEERMHIDLETLPIRLSEGRHKSPEGGMCVMEMVSFLEGEDFSDRPKCVSPVIAEFCRTLNDAMPPFWRNKLQLFVPRLIGTNKTGLEKEYAAFFYSQLSDSKHGNTYAGAIYMTRAKEYLDRCGLIISVGYVAPCFYRADDWQGALDALDGALKIGGKPPVEINPERLRELYAIAPNVQTNSAQTT